MSSNFSANQYEGTFGSKRLLNWSPSKDFKERPSAHVGHTSFIVNSRGHLLPGVKKGVTWPDIKGTWDLPTRIPANHIDPTARSKDGLRRLKLWGICPPEEGKSQSDRGSRNTDEEKHRNTGDLGKKTSEDAPPPAAEPSKEAEVRSESQSRSIAGSESQASQRHEPGSAAQQDLQATGNNTPMSATEEIQALISRVGSETQEIPESILGTPHRIIRYSTATEMNKE